MRGKTFFYTLRQGYAARLYVFALADGFLLGIFFAAASFSGRLTLWEAVVQFFIPFNIQLLHLFWHIIQQKNRFGSIFCFSMYDMGCCVVFSFAETDL